MAIPQEAIDKLRELTIPECKINGLVDLFQMIHDDEIESGLPPFLEEKCRQREAFLGLIRDITHVLGNPKDYPKPGDGPMAVNKAINKALNIWI